MVKVIEIDSQGRINLSRKAVLGGGEGGSTESHDNGAPRNGARAPSALAPPPGAGIAVTAATGDRAGDPGPSSAREPMAKARPPDGAFLCLPFAVAGRCLLPFTCLARRSRLGL